MPERRRAKKRAANQDTRTAAIRKFGPNRRSVTGHVPAQKKPGLVAFESTLERDLIILLEFDPLVSGIVEQPTRIEFGDGSYTPDFLVTYFPEAGRRQSYIEVKYRDDLAEQWPDLHPRLRAGCRYARSIDRTFKILTEVEIRTLRLDNITQLWPYRSSAVEPEEIACIREALELLGTASPDRLLEYLSPDLERRAVLLFTIWHMLANGVIATDLDGVPLSNSSPVWLADGSQR